MAPEARGVRLAGIEAVTCGLRISASPTSGNLNPQETTKQEAPDVGPDGANLSCPGSNVVEDEEAEKAIKSDDACGGIRRGSSVSGI